MKFVKMNGCGNDYVYFDLLGGGCAEDIIPAIEKLSDRHFGVGGDGVVLIMKSDLADARMRMFNADGSEGKMCGNAVRCVGKYLYDNGYVKSPDVSVETASGVKKLALRIENGVCTGATVNMGKPIVKAEDVPADVKAAAGVTVDTPWGDGALVNVPVTVCGRTFGLTAVSMGNPHCVAFIDEPVSDFALEFYGAALEKHPMFPERVNAEFVNVGEDNMLTMRVWERGSGETMACGTGSCATAVAAVLNGYADASRPVKVKLKGGVLTIELRDDGVYMSGDAKVNFTGETEL